MKSEHLNKIDNLGKTISLTEKADSGQLQREREGERKKESSLNMTSC